MCETDCGVSVCRGVLVLICVLCVGVRVGDWSASVRLTTYLPIHVDVFSAPVGIMLTGSYMR
jgi:hypothetical protein